MRFHSRIVLPVLVVVALVAATWLVLERNCPSSGIAVTPGRRHIHRLKNRTAFPQTADFDPRVTLAALLEPGDDTSRWSTDRAARIQGHVIDVAYAGSEAANCFSPSRRDIHIAIATHAGAAQSEQVVLEVTPKLSEWARQQGMDWSEATLRSQLIGRWCEFEGWLFFDVGHAEDSENISPGKPANWRATAWEVHPITKITVIR